MNRTRVLLHVFEGSQIRHPKLFRKLRLCQCQEGGGAFQSESTSSSSLNQHRKWSHRAGAEPETRLVLASSFAAPRLLEAATQCLQGAGLTAPAALSP